MDGIAAGDSASAYGVGLLEVPLLAVSVLTS